MLPPFIFDNFDDPGQKQPNVGELSDEAIAIGAAHAMPAFIREFIRRNNPELKLKSEEQIAREEEAQFIEARNEIAEREELLLTYLIDEDEGEIAQRGERLWEELSHSRNTVIHHPCFLHQRYIPADFVENSVEGDEVFFKQVHRANFHLEQFDLDFGMYISPCPLPHTGDIPLDIEKPSVTVFNRKTGDRLSLHKDSEDRWGNWYPPDDDFEIFPERTSSSPDALMILAAVNLYRVELYRKSLGKPAPWGEEKGLQPNELKWMSTKYSDHPNPQVASVASEAGAHILNLHALHGLESNDDIS